MKYNTVIFDLDGTLLNTLEDLAASVNHALCGRTNVRRTLMEVRAFVGNGVHRLMELSLPGGEKNPQFEAAMADFRAHYAVHCRDHTRCYPQIEKMLDALAARGLKMGIVSNKPDAQVRDMNTEYFGGVFGAAIGEKEGVRRKPAPDSLFCAMDTLGAAKEATLYVGDSEVDVMTAKNAGVDCLSVTWGFRDKPILERAGAVRFIDAPMELPALLDAMK